MIKTKMKRTGVKTALYYIRNQNCSNLMMLNVNVVRLRGIGKVV